MKGTLFVILAVWTISATTAIPRITRAINPEEDDTATTSSMEPTFRVCAPQTPCAWEVYNSHTKSVYSKIQNTYCICGEGSRCEDKEEDKFASVYIYKCRPTPES